MVSLEARLDGLQPRPWLEERDLDLDGKPEIFLQNGIVQAVVRDDGNAPVIELDSYSLGHNFADTLSRRTEHYYSKFSGEHHAQAQHDGIASAHDRVRMKHEISATDIEPDARPRGLFVDSWCAQPGGNVTPTDYERVETTGDAVRFRSRLGQATLEKRIELVHNRLTATYRFEPISAGRFETRIDLAMPSCDGMLGRYVHEGGIPGGFGQRIEVEALTTLALEDALLGGLVVLLCSPPAHVVGQPHLTVSQSEDGFEKVMQAVTLTLAWTMEQPIEEIIVALEIHRQPIMQA